MTVETDELGLRWGLRPSPMPYGHASVGALVDALPSSGDRPALIDRTGAVSYVELAVRVAAAAERMTSVGVRPGSVVAGSAPNRIDLVIAFLATQRIGAIWVGINPALGPAEKLAQFADCG